MLQKLTRQGVALAYGDGGDPSARPIVFLHDWGASRSYMAAQSSHFATTHRSVAPDFRGHGASAAPLQDYSIGRFADDVAWLCDELALAAPVVVGHGLGGAVALELAAERPDLVAGIVMIDGFVLPRSGFWPVARPATDATRSADGLLGLPGLQELLFHRGDDPAIMRLLTRTMQDAAEYALTSSLGNMLAHDAWEAAAACRAPVAYLATKNCWTDLALFRRLCPTLTVTSIAATGHYAPMLAPDLVTAEIAAFADSLGSAHGTARAPGRPEPRSVRRRVAQSAAGRA